MEGGPGVLLGRRLGSYHIVGLGAGRMGLVFKTRDIRLTRTVAIKLLPRHLSERANVR